MKNGGRPQKWPDAYIPRGTCRWCALHIDKYDYWFWWAHRYHRACRVYMAMHPEEVVRREKRTA